MSRRRLRSRRRKSPNEDRTNRHHRKTRHKNGSNHPDNISIVTVKHHNAFNILFDGGNMPVPDMVKLLTEVWINPQWEIIARRRELCQSSI